MRILLDCRELSTGPKNGEKRLYLLSCAAILAKSQGVEWLFLVDRRYPGALPPESGVSLPVSGTIPGAPGRWLWRGWRLPRMVKKYHADRVMEADEIVGGAGAADERYGPLSGEEKEEVKRSYAEGKEYFLAAVGGVRPEEVVDLLKAFSLFKKRQRSNMQLVLGGAGPVRGRGAALAAKLATYKYRADTHLYDKPGEEEWRKMVAAAYAVVIFSGRESLGLAILNAWKAETPVIAAGAVTLQELGGAAVHYARPRDPASLAGLLMGLYTNEGLRAGLVAKGRHRLLSFSWEQSAGQVWERILRAKDLQ